MMYKDGLVEYAREQLQRVASRLEEVLASGDAEAIHQLRVASRRLSEPLGLMRVWAKGASVRRARRGLRRLRRVFRQVRDLDVLRMRLGEAGTQQILDAEELADLDGVLSRRRAGAFEKACRRARRRRVGRTLELVRDLLDEAAGQVEDSPLVACAPLASMLDKRAAALLELDPRASDSVDLHQIRLRLKRFRYCLELREELTGEHTGAVAKAARAMQDALGRWSDQLVAAERVSRVARCGRRLRQRTASSARLLRYAAWWAQAAETGRQAILEQWPGFRELIATAVSREPNRELAGSGQA